MHVIRCVQAHRHAGKLLSQACGDAESLAVPGDGVDVVAPAGQIETDPGQAQVADCIVTVGVDTKVAALPDFIPPAESLLKPRRQAETARGRESHPVQQPRRLVVAQPPRSQPHSRKVRSGETRMRRRYPEDLDERPLAGNAEEREPRALRPSRILLSYYDSMYGAQNSGAEHLRRTARLVGG